MPRPLRFLDTSSASPEPTDLTRPFYSDSQLDSRMTHVRQTIVQVRQIWDAERQNLAIQLMQWLEEQQASAAAVSDEQQQQQQQQDLQDATGKASESDWPLVLQRWRLILAADRNWADLRPPATSVSHKEEEQQDFSVLREYTDEKSYQLVFSRVLQALRSGDDSRVLLFVYLIELINIDLFNYCRQLPPCQSPVYRGMTLSKADWLSFRRQLELPATSRYVAVPLALTSASKSWEVAMQFMVKETEKSANSGNVPCMLVLHVVDVPDSLMGLYRKRFPQSVVSTICAVDISGVSTHPDEQEVLLRGAFYQILDMKEGVELVLPPVCQQPQPLQQEVLTVNVLEMLLITANRDHLSNGRLGDQDAPARALFAAIVRVTRYRFCLQMCQERGMAESEAEYAAALCDADQELQRLLA